MALKKTIENSCVRCLKGAPKSFLKMHFKETSRGSDKLTSTEPSKTFYEKIFKHPREDPKETTFVKLLEALKFL